MNIHLRIEEGPYTCSLRLGGELGRNHFHPSDKEYGENPIPPMDLGMFRFMVILTSYFTMAKALGWVTSQNASGGDQANWKSTTTAQSSVKMLLTMSNTSKCPHTQP